MIFQHTHQWMTQPSPHTGHLKTQTRRLVKSGQIANECILPGKSRDWINEVIAPVDDWRWKAVYRVGETYAVQPGRGKAAIARIRVLEIRHEDVRHISKADARAEGYASPLDFLATWTKMHAPDKHFESGGDGCYLYRANRFDKWRTVNEGALWQMPWSRPQARYQAWALTFEVVK